MAKLRKIKDIFYMISVVLIIGVQGYYLITIHGKTQSKIKETVSEIETIMGRIANLEAGLKRMPEIEKMLVLVNAQKNAIGDTMPTAQGTINQMRIFNNALSGGQFYDVKVIETGSAASEDEMATMIQKDYEVSFTSSYKNTKKILESLHSAYKLININSMEIDSSIQFTENEEQLKHLYSYFGEELAEVVTTKLDFSIYEREKGEDLHQNQEVYTPNFSLVNSNSTPFDGLGLVERLQGEKNIEEDKSYKETPTSKQEINADSIFQLEIQDILTSGDTYQLMGPDDEENYLGLVAQSSVYIRITLHENGYEFSIEDENGNIKQGTYEQKIKSPILYISSHMRQVQQAMPNVHVYIYNYGEDEMQVKLKGDLTKQIHLYDKFGEELLQGEAAGNVRFVE